MLSYLKEEWNVPRILSVSIILLLLGLMGLGIFYVGWVDFVDNYEVGYKYDLWTGKIEILDKQGYIVTPPILVKVHTVDLRPMQVCINANARVLNCKLVRFNPDGLELFLSWHGRNNYVSSNGTSSSLSAVRLDEILKSYAYDGNGKGYSFLEITRELKPGDDLQQRGSVP